MILFSIAMLWVLVVAMAITLFALARQIGILHERIAPMGALVTAAGPSAGDPVPHLHATTIDGHDFVLGLGHPPARRLLLLFVGADCPVCRKIVPIAKAVAAAEALDLVFVGDAPVDEQRLMIARYRIEAFPFVNDATIGRACHVDRIPYAVLIRTDAIIAAKGLVSSREHLESLVNADDSGFGSAQAYVRSLAAPAGAAR